MVAYNFKNIRTVPPGKEIIDIILSKTQRQTPTVVHAGYSIQRIRAFYMRKVKFTSETITERLDRILEDFPRLDDVHPFYADLCNVLYDRDHYKLALGQINIAKHLVNNVARDYVRMLKYGDSLYRCKQLKRAALGRMCTILKKQAPSLSYLEEVRKHLSRLPSIDPNSRTLLITGFPNVGKSSFMNQVTHADVDVQPYAFTTKSLFVGHMDYKYLRWQVIDSPGVLDKPLEERNTIEMQAITALAHLQCCVLYFFDVSEQCGWSLDQQANLFLSLRPLFSNKPLVVVANKVDIVPWDEMDASKREMIERLAKESKAPLLQMSAMNAVGIANVKKTACEALLERRVEQKARYQQINSTQTPEKPARDIMWERGGPRVYSVDLREQYRLHNEEWALDVIPDVMDQRIVFDLVDSDIENRLEELEREEKEPQMGIDENMGEEDQASDLDKEQQTDIDRKTDEEDFASEVDEEEKEFLDQACKSKNKRSGKKMSKQATEGETCGASQISVFCDKICHLLYFCFKFRVY